nr:MAG TPA: hypothetical protein [Caudoviricetes sp.]
MDYLVRLLLCFRLTLVCTVPAHKQVPSHRLIFAYS